MSHWPLSFDRFGQPSPNSGCATERSSAARLCGLETISLSGLHLRTNRRPQSLIEPQTSMSLGASTLGPAPAFPKPSLLGWKSGSSFYETSVHLPACTSVLTRRFPSTRSRSDLLVVSCSVGPKTNKCIGPCDPYVEASSGRSN